MGIGGFFVEINDYLQKNYKLSFIGQDMDSTTYSLCKMNLIMNGINANISIGNSLLNPANVNNDELEKVDIAVCNPPFGYRNWGYDSWRQKIPYKQEIDIIDE